MGWLVVLGCGWSICPPNAINLIIKITLYVCAKSIYVYIHINENQIQIIPIVGKQPMYITGKQMLCMFIFEFRSTLRADRSNENPMITMIHRNIGYSLDGGQQCGACAFEALHLKRTFRNAVSSIIDADSLHLHFWSAYGCVCLFAVNWMGFLSAPGSD